MVTIVSGTTNKPISTNSLIEFFKKNDSFEGKLYTGYPIVFTAGESITLDALWISEKYGIIIFDLIEGTEDITEDIIIERQDNLYDKIEANLTGYRELKKRRELLVNIDVITFCPAIASYDIDDEVKVSNKEDLLSSLISNIDSWSDKSLYKTVLSIIQSLITLQSSSKRPEIKDENSKGAKLKMLEDSIANLDLDQEVAIIESFNGIQRIRGLAGSGKTIVLALKTAYLHTQHPDWKIAVTFHTRSLKNQFKELLSKFCIQKSGYDYDKTKINIIHAWGSKKQGPGIYYNFCLEHNIEYFDYGMAKRYRAKTRDFKKSVFEIICEKALSETQNFNETYDAILIDEAQDLSAPFLKLCFNILKNPKRLVYAYDELQNLNEGSSLPNPVSIFNQELEQDTILKVCYRNSRPLLVTAHALGFGIYRDESLIKENDPKLVQFFDEPKLWNEIGYSTKTGELKADANVVLVRDEESSPKFLETHSDDILVLKDFKNKSEQAEWIASEIKNNLDNDELLHRDIMVINPIALTTEKEVNLTREKLFDYGIKSHIAGEMDADVFMEDESITFTGIYRAKGNEVPMVYIMNANDCFSGAGLIQLRNTLFTAITRSKAWVRICGGGKAMQNLIAEYNEVRKRNYSLDFIYPTPEEIKKMNIIHRDRTESEKEAIKTDKNILQNIQKIADDVISGNKFLEDYTEEEQHLIKLIIEKIQKK